MNEIEKIKGSISFMEQWKQVWISELAKCYMDTAIQAVQEKLERENPKPLTLDELESMVDEPIYCVSIDGEEKNQWGILALSMMGTVGIWTDEIYIFLERDYGKTWLAYRYKPDLVNVNKIEHIAQVGEMMEGE